MSDLLGIGQLGAATINGLFSMWGGRKQRTAENAQNAANMQWQRENMFHQLQWEQDEAVRSRDWSAGQAGIARDWNADMFAQERNFNAQQAAENRDFQERMSNTQYQRAVRDMEAAGLNPMLAYQQGGAGNVGGASASASAPSTSQAQGAKGNASGAGSGPSGHFQNYIGNAVSSALSALSLMSGVEQINAQTEKTGQEARLTGAMADAAEVLVSGGAHTDDVTGKTTVYAKGAKQHSEIREQLIKERTARHNEMRAKYGADADKHDPSIRETEEKLLKSQLPKAESEAALENMIKRWIGDTGSAGAKGIEGILRMALPLILRAMGPDRVVNINRR